MNAFRALAASLLLAALLAPATVQAETIPGVVQGTGSISDFYVRSDAAGYLLRGGAFQTTHVCSDCFVRIVLVDSDLTVLQDGAQVTLAPGEYELRHFAGVLGKSQTSHERGNERWFIQIDAAAEVHRVES